MTAERCSVGVLVAMYATTMVHRFAAPGHSISDVAVAICGASVQLGQTGVYIGHKAGLGAGTEAQDECCHEQHVHVARKASNQAADGAEQSREQHNAI